MKLWSLYFSGVSLGLRTSQQGKGLWRMSMWRLGGVCTKHSKYALWTTIGNINYWLLGNREKQGKKNSVELQTSTTTKNNNRLELQFALGLSVKLLCNNQSKTDCAICFGVNSVYKLEWQTIILAITLRALPGQGDTLLFKPYTTLMPPASLGSEDIKKKMIT